MKKRKFELVTEYKPSGDQPEVSATGVTRVNLRMLSRVI